MLMDVAVEEQDLRPQPEQSGQRFCRCRVPLPGAVEGVERGVGENEEGHVRGQPLDFLGQPLPRRRGEVELRLRPWPPARAGV